MTRTHPTRLTDDDRDAALRTLDVAPAHLDPRQSVRKDELLARILESSPATHGVTSALRPDQRAVVLARRRRRRAARWAAPLVAAAATATWFAWPGHPGTGSSSGAAFASWTATPTVVDPTTRLVAERVCRDSVRGTVDHLRDEAVGRPTLDPAMLRTVLAERRGGVILLHLEAPDGSSQDCWLDAARPDEVVASGGGLATEQSAPPVLLRPDQIEVAGGGRFGEEGRTYASVGGRVGSAVRGVTIRSSGHTVQATVSNGYMAAWWPTTALPENAPDPIVAYDLTLADGRVVRDAPVVGDTTRRPGPRQVTGVSTGGGTDCSTVGGRVGTDVVGVVVHAGGATSTAQVVDGVFVASFSRDTRTDGATFDLTLRGGTVLRGQRPAR